MTPLDQIPPDELLARIAQILNVPKSDVFADNIKADQVSGFYLLRSGLAVRLVDYVISARDYYGITHSPGQPPADELFTTTSKDRTENEKARQRSRTAQLIFLGVTAALLLGIVYAFLKFSPLFP